MSYDVYLAHASENIEFANSLAQQLRLTGLRVWFNHFIVGPSIREQMERGLRDADFGVVVLSPEFFSKKWAKHELDALLAIGEPGTIRILPVWYGVSASEVLEQSPMLAMRSAAVFKGSVESIATALLEAMLHLTAKGSPAKRLRSQIRAGLRWKAQPVFLPTSLQAYEEQFFGDFIMADLAYYPSVVRRPPGRLLPLLEVLGATLLSTVNA